MENLEAGGCGAEHVISFDVHVGVTGEKESVSRQRAKEIAPTKETPAQLKRRVEVGGC